MSMRLRAGAALFSSLSRASTFPLSARSYHIPVAHYRSPIDPVKSLHGTTILSVRKGRDVVVIGDGQVSIGQTVVKANARKVRLLGGGKVITGFAGSTADCFALLDRLDQKLEQYPGQLLRAALELAKAWRTDKYLRHLEAWMIAVDKDISITLTGNGDVLSDPKDGIIGIGSGGQYAVAAARALIDVPGLTAQEIAIKSMTIASDICVYTNNNFVMESFQDGVLVSQKPITLPCKPSDATTVTSSTENNKDTKSTTPSI